MTPKKLPDIIKTLEEVEEPFRVLYEKNGEEFVFSALDETETKKKLAEFRDTNRSKHKEIEELKKQLKSYDGIDPAKWAEAQKAMEKLSAIDEKQLIDQGKFDEFFSKRSEAMRQEHERSLKAKDEAYRKAIEERDGLKHKLGTHLIDAEVQKAVMKTGKLREGAIEDVLSRARRVWSLDEHGNIIPKKNGETLFGRDGEQLKIEEWANDLPTDAPHLFESSKGGGAEGGTAKKTDDKMIDNDPVLIGKHLKEIAAGTIKVRMQ